MEMMKIPSRYKKAMAPLDKTARERLWGIATLSEGEGATSELSELIDSFYEGRAAGDQTSGEWVIGFGSDTGDGAGEMLMDTAATLADSSSSDLVAEWIRVEVEDALRVFGTLLGADELRKRVVGRLREKGYDSGLCRSEWHRTKRLPAGHHGYIDITIDDGTRYIVEINLSGEFDVARPSDNYINFLRSIPKVFVGKPEVLKRLIPVMCAAAKQSMKSAEMHIPPWRTREYMQNKWFSSYTRATNFRRIAVTNNTPERSREISRRKFCSFGFSPRGKDQGMGI